MFSRYARKRLTDTKPDKKAPASVGGLTLNEDGRFVFVLAKRDKGRICQVSLCKNPRARGWRTCHRCRVRKWRANNPEMAAWRQVKDRAARHGIPFNLSLEDLLAAVGREYVEKAGVSNAALQLDRIEPELGYVKGNIRALTGFDNRRKGGWFPDFEDESLIYHGPGDERGPDFEDESLVYYGPDNEGDPF